MNGRPGDCCLKITYDATGFGETVALYERNHCLPYVLRVVQ